MNEIKKVVSIRQYKSQMIMGHNQSFEEWMNSIETIIMNGAYEHSTTQRLYGKKHSQLLKKVQNIHKEHSDIIKMFHEGLFNKLLMSLETTNTNLTPFDAKSGRTPIPSIIAQFLLWGLDISKRETGNYELFRFYYHEALKNNFNMNELAQALFKDKSEYKLELSCHQYFPSVPASKQSNTNWVRSLRQSLKKIIENEKR
jgi:hypothetical protein